mgnify:CR=1 FL=1
MGTLGCINDMLQRDKENRELRKRNRERLEKPLNFDPFGHAELSLFAKI